MNLDFVFGLDRVFLFFEELPFRIEYKIYCWLGLPEMVSTIENTVSNGEMIASQSKEQGEKRG